MRLRWLLIIGTLLFWGNLQPTQAEEIALTAKSALLADLATGKILWSRSPDLRCYPASLTKIMTALIILERGNLEDWVTVTKEAAFTGESSMALKEGERVRLSDLLNAILVRSANDACVAAAIHLAGSVEQFVKWMNEKAQELGMVNTHFVNPHGLHDPQHYTTARDLLVLTSKAMENPIFRQIVTQREITIAPNEKSALRRYWNRNKLLEQYPGCDGVKTGYTGPAGRCIVATATRNGWQLVAIVLGSQDHFGDAARLLDFGFFHFVRLTLAEKGEPIGLFHIPGGTPSWLQAVAAETVQVIVPKAMVGRIRSTVRQVVAQPPIEQGAAVAEIVWDVPGASRYRVNLLAAQPVGWSLAAKAHMFGERALLIFFLSFVGYFLWTRWQKKRKGGRRW